MKKLKAKDLKAGQIYYAERPGRSNKEIAFIVQKSTDRYICIKDKTRTSFFSSLFSYDNYNYREANYIEKTWFNACVKADKYVPKPKLDVYAIF